MNSSPLALKLITWSFTRENAGVSLWPCPPFQWLLNTEPCQLRGSESSGLGISAGRVPRAVTKKAGKGPGQGETATETEHWLPVAIEKTGLI